MVQPVCARTGRLGPNGNVAKLNAAGGRVIRPPERRAGSTYEPEGGFRSMLWTGLLPLSGGPGRCGETLRAVEVRKARVTPFLDLLLPSGPDFRGVGAAYHRCAACRRAGRIFCPCPRTRGRSLYRSPQRSRRAAYKKQSGWSKRVPAPSTARTAILVRNKAF